MSEKPFETIGQYTTFPNQVIDQIMPLCKPNTWKIVCATIRNTIGWHKNQDRISISQYMEQTGIVSRSTCLKAINDAVEQGFIIQSSRRTDRGKEFDYSLNREYTISRGTNGSKPHTGTETVPVPSTETVPPTGTETVPTKEKYLNKSLNKRNDDTDHHFGEAVKAFEQIGGSINAFQAQSIQALVEDWTAHIDYLPDSHPDKSTLPEQVVALAIQEMGKHISRPNLKYLEKILHSWRESGINSRNKQSVSSPEDYDGGEFAEFINS